MTLYIKYSRKTTNGYIKLRKKVTQQSIYKHNNYTLQQYLDGLLTGEYYLIHNINNKIYQTKVKSSDNIEILYDYIPQIYNNEINYKIIELIKIDI